MIEYHNKVYQELSQLADTAEKVFNKAQTTFFTPNLDNTRLIYHAVLEAKGQLETGLDVTQAPQIAAPAA